MRILLALFIVVTIVACSDSSSDQPKSANTTNIDSLFKAYHTFKLEINPVEATKGGYNQYNDTIANFISDAYIDVLVNRYDGFLKAISSIESDSLNDADQLSLKVMKWDCEVKREGLTNAVVTVPSPMFDQPNFKLMPLTQIASFNLYIGQLASGSSVQPFNTVEDYKNWLMRVDDYLVWLRTAQINMKQGMEAGLVWPKVLIERVITQVEPFAKVDDNLFLSPINQIPEGISDVDKEEIRKDYNNMVENNIVPAHEELLTFLQEEYLPAGRESTGISDVPNGLETYRYLLKYHTTTNMTPDEIFELGMSEVKRIRSEMEKVKAEVGFDGTLEEFFAEVRSSQEQMPFSAPEGVIDNFRSIQQRVEANLDSLFSVSPKAGFEVRRTEAFREASASAEYVPGSRDGSRPGVFYVPIPDVASYNKFSDEALFLHEAIPGHHYQLSLQQENDDIPAFLHSEGFSVFVEGWALYSESLGKELGLYKDPIQYFGMLSAEMHRAIRLVVDAGMHAKGWTREEAIQFSLENEAESEAAITSEIERYMATPGQATSYKIGQLKIRALREKAAKALGEKFDIREFHNQVLNSGNMPLVLLEEKIDTWINEVK